MLLVNVVVCVKTLPANLDLYHNSVIQPMFH